MMSTAPRTSEKGQWAQNPLALTAVLALVGLVAIAALVFALLAFFDSEPDASPAAVSTQMFRGSSIPVGVPTIVSEGELRAFGAAYQPVYWAGPKNGMRYELTATEGGDFFVRYLPNGITAGDPGEFLTVATYSVANGYQLLAAEARTDGATGVDSESGAIVVTYDNDDKRAYFAFDGSDFQVEVFDPEAGAAKQLVSDGSLVLVR